MPLEIHNAEAFAAHIERLVNTKNMSYMEAVLHYCEQRNLEPENIAPFLSDKIKSAIAHEASALHLMPRAAELPV